MTLALVTGAGRGIGRDVALMLAARGVDLVLVGKSADGLNLVAAKAESTGVKVALAAADLATDRGIESALGATLQAGCPDVVVHNAGVIERASIEALSPESWEHQIAVNLRAPFLLTRGLLPAMRRAGHGRFVFVGSIASTLGSANAAAYCASKWGLLGFAKSLAEELSGSGLMAVSVLPGSVDTEMLIGSGFTPRMSPADVARTIVHYCLDAPLAHNGASVEMFGT